MNMQIVPITDFRHRTKTMITCIREKNGSLYMTQHGRPSPSPIMTASPYWRRYKPAKRKMRPFPCFNHESEGYGRETPRTGMRLQKWVSSKLR